MENQGVSRIIKLKVRVTAAAVIMRYVCYSGPYFQGIQSAA
jgi:hypothetical protein